MRFLRVVHLLAERRHEVVELDVGVAAAPSEGAAHAAAHARRHDAHAGHHAWHHAHAGQARRAAHVRHRWHRDRAHRRRRRVHRHRQATHGHPWHAAGHAAADAAAAAAHAAAAAAAHAAGPAHVGDRHAGRHHLHHFVEDLDELVLRVASVHRVLDRLGDRLVDGGHSWRQLAHLAARERALVVLGLVLLLALDHPDLEVVGDLHHDDLHDAQHHHHHRPDRADEQVAEHVVLLVQHQHVSEHRHHDARRVERAEEEELAAHAHLVERAQVGGQLLVDGHVEADPAARAVAEALRAELDVLEELPRPEQLERVVQEDVGHPQRRDHHDAEEHVVEQVGVADAVERRDVVLGLEQVEHRDRDRRDDGAERVDREAVHRLEHVGHHADRLELGREHGYRLPSLLRGGDAHLELGGAHHLELDWVHRDALDDHDRELDDEVGDELDEAGGAERHHELRGLQRALERQRHELFVERLEQPALHVHPHDLERHHEGDRVHREDARERELEHRQQQHEEQRARVHDVAALPVARLPHRARLVLPRGEQHAAGVHQVEAHRHDGDADAPLLPLQLDLLGERPFEVEVAGDGAERVHRADDGLDEREHRRERHEDEQRALERVELEALHPLLEMEARRRRHLGGAAEEGPEDHHEDDHQRVDHEVEDDVRRRVERELVEHRHPVDGHERDAKVVLAAAQPVGRRHVDDLVPVGVEVAGRVVVMQRRKVAERDRPVDELLARE